MATPTVRQVIQRAREIAWETQAALLVRSTPRKVPFFLFFTVLAKPHWMHQDSRDIGQIGALVVLANKIEEALKEEAEK